LIFDLPQALMKRIQRSFILESEAASDPYFRHTIAALMLEGGAETRYIQEMLGQARIPP